MTTTDSTSTTAAVAAAAADVRLVRGHLAADELAAIAVVVSAMSVTSRLEAEERALAEGRHGASAWGAPAHTHAAAHRERLRPSPSAWIFTDR